MKKTRDTLIWIVCYSISLASLIVSFPIVLFTLYPYSIMGIAVYAIVVIVLSILSFRKNADKNAIPKRVLFGMLLVPIIISLAILVLIQTGLLHYPG